MLDFDPRHPVVVRFTKNDALALSFAWEYWATLREDQWLTEDDFLKAFRRGFPKFLNRALDVENCRNAEDSRKNHKKKSSETEKFHFRSAHSLDQLVEAGVVIDANTPSVEDWLVEQEEMLDGPSNIRVAGHLSQRQRENTLTQIADLAHTLDNPKSFTKNTGLSESTYFQLKAEFCRAARRDMGSLGEIAADTLNFFLEKIKRSACKKAARSARGDQDGQRMPGQQLALF